MRSRDFKARFHGLRIQESWTYHALSLTDQHRHFFLEDRPYDIEYEGFRAAEVLYIFCHHLPMITRMMLIQIRSDFSLHEFVVFHRQMTLYCGMNTDC